jgi:uridine kinase
MDQNTKPYLIGITGGSASGKTHFLKSLMAAIDPSIVCLVSQDNYYRNLEFQPKDHQGIENFDLPSSIDHELYESDIRKIINGQEVEINEYNFNNDNQTPGKTIVYKPAPLVIIEGIFVFHFKQIDQLLNLRLFVDASEMVKIKRRIIRDNVERGYDLDDVLYRYEHHVTPSYRNYIEPYKESADLIIPNNHNFQKALTIIVDHLKSEAEKRKNIYA